MQNRTYFTKLKKTYTKIPNKIYHIGLSSNAIFLFSVLASLPEDFNPSVYYLAKRVYWSRNTVYKYLNELINSNILILVTPASEGQIATYKFSEISDWYIVC